MGQPVAVTTLPSSTPGVVRFDTNRVLTGTGHESYEAGTEIFGHRPCDVLARRILEDHSGVRAVHINASIVTVKLDRGADEAAIAETIASLYTYYRPGVLPPVIEV